MFFFKILRGKLARGWQKKYPFGHAQTFDRCVRTYVRTDFDDVMAIKPNFLTSIGYHIFLTMVLHARASSARAELRYNLSLDCPPCLVLFKMAD